MMVPDFQALMRPVLNSAKDGEVQISEVVSRLVTEFSLNEDEQNEMLPSGKQTRFANRVHWARSYLKQAGLLQNVKRGHFTITDAGIKALNSSEQIDSKFLEQYTKFVDFKSRTRKPSNIDTDSI